MDHIDCLNLKSPGFLAAVKAGDKIALQQKQTCLFADMAHLIHLFLCHIFRILPQDLGIAIIWFHRIHLFVYCQQQKKMYLFSLIYSLGVSVFPYISRAWILSIFSPFFPNSLHFPVFRPFLGVAATDSNPLDFMRLCGQNHLEKAAISSHFLFLKMESFSTKIHPSPFDRKVLKTGEYFGSYFPIFPVFSTSCGDKKLRENRDFSPSFSPFSEKRWSENIFGDVPKRLKGPVLKIGRPA